MQGLIPKPGIGFKRNSLSRYWTTLFKRVWNGSVLEYYAEHATDHLTLPVPATNAEGGVTHPSVIDFNLINKGKWNGFRYWMAFTPLPTLNPDPNENPCIVASNDGVTWVVPDGASNPIHPTPPVSYNADTNLFYDSGKLYCFFRTWTDAPNKSWIAYRYSSDGITWSDAEYSYNMVNNTEVVAPCILKQSNTYYMYGIDATSATPEVKVLYRYPSVSIGGWLNATRELCSIDFTNTIFNDKVVNSKQYVWHFEIKYIGDKWLGVFYVRTLDDGTTNMYQNVYLASSTNGVDFIVSKYPLFAKYQKGSGKWDTGLYKSTVVPKVVNDKLYFDLWYPGWINEHEVFPTFIGKTEIKAITSGITHAYGGNSINALRTSELATAIAKTSGYIFGDDCNRANETLLHSPCGVDYSIFVGAANIVDNYIANTGNTFIQLTVPLNYEASFDAINGNGVVSSDGGFRVYPKATAYNGYSVRIMDGTAGTKVLDTSSGDIRVIQYKTKTFLKAELNNFKVVVLNSNVKYYVNGCLIFDHDFVLANFSSQAMMDNILGGAKLVFYMINEGGTKIKNLTIKSLM